MAQIATRGNLNERLNNEKSFAGRLRGKHVEVRIRRKCSDEVGDIIEIITETEKDLAIPSETSVSYTLKIAIGSGPCLSA